MSKTRIWLLAALLPALSTHAAKPLDKDALVFDTQVAINVDAQGKVAGAKADAKLPPALRNEIEALARSWRFAAPVQQGKPAPGKTYVRLGACGLPAGDAYQFAFAFRDNGPGKRKEGQSFPRIPPGLAQRGKGLAYTLQYRVRPDGEAEVVSIKYVESPGRSLEPQIARSVREWLRTIEFLPEELDGQPVATVVETSVEVTFDREVDSPMMAQRAVKDQMRRYYAALPECLAANTGDAGRAVVLDSPFKKLPSEG